MRTRQKRLKKPSAKEKRRDRVDLGIATCKLYCAPYHGRSSTSPSSLETNSSPWGSAERSGGDDPRRPKVAADPEHTQHGDLLIKNSIYRHSTHSPETVKRTPKRKNTSIEEVGTRWAWGRENSKLKFREKLDAGRKRPATPLQRRGGDRADSLGSWAHPSENRNDTTGTRSVR